jgi:hypothetical protein
MKSRDDRSRRRGPDGPPARLRDCVGQLQEPSARWAVSILGRAGTYRLVPGRQERIWADLQAFERPPRRRTLRFTFATVSLVVGALFASAALAQWPGWLAKMIHAAPSEATPGFLARHAIQTAEAPRPTPAIGQSAPAASTAPALGPPGGLAGPHPRRLSKSATPEESEILLAAMRALRAERNPERARTLLSQYLAHHAKGALAEEALVMLVEAAAAHGDGDAHTLAARYFELFPKGGFGDKVRSSLATSAARSE